MECKVKWYCYLKSHFLGRDIQLCKTFHLTSIKHWRTSLRPGTWNSQEEHWEKYNYMSLNIYGTTSASQIHDSQWLLTNETLCVSNWLNSSHHTILALKLKQNKMDTKKSNLKFIQMNEILHYFFFHLILY